MPKSRAMINTLSRGLLRLSNRHFILTDAIAFLIIPGLALGLRLDNLFVFHLYEYNLVVVTILFLIVKLSVLWGFGFYKRYWRYASIDELTQIIISMIAAVILQSLLFYALHSKSDFVSNLPRSLPLLDGMLSLIFVGGLRFSVRAVERVCQTPKQTTGGDRVLIAGAGNAGVSLAQEMQRNPQLGLHPVAFVDDDPAKLNLRIRGLAVVGNRRQIPQIVHFLGIRRVIIAMPTVSGKVIREIVQTCQTSSIPTSTLPGIHEILNGKVSVESIRDVKIEDLLRREPIQTDVQKVNKFLRGKKVLITGAGGSIGSEICRQVLKCRPAQIILVGHGENSIFNIQQELEQLLTLVNHEHPVAQTCISTLIADIRFLARLEYAFDEFRPDIIFHAAAHKHVPLMELNSPEAITNNVLGTKNLLDLALRFNVQHFVMISTDKAVNPTSVMGATKRTAEMLVLQAAQKSGKPFVVVRFGNVLGSRGSVVPTFKRQIAAGGPITVTHPDICRYFMTIPEAVQLVLQAAVIGCGGEIFMLNMGQPIKIVDLAKDLIRLSGYEVGKDIDIQFTGLRPGEKLFEELFISGEEYEPTQHEKLLRVRNASRIIPENLDLIVEALCTAAQRNDPSLIICLLKRLVSEYAPKEETPALLSQRLDSSINGSSRRQGCDRVLNTARVKLLQYEQDLQRALERQEFRLFYQPIILLQTNQITGFEALLRWQHPARGLISADEFIPVAVETGLIIPIGLWVIRQACTQLKTWQQLFPTAALLTMSVNLASKQFFHADLIAQINQILQETNVKASSLRLELSEGVALENPESALATLMRLKSLGVQLQIDNFGIGYSFLSLLQRLPHLLDCEKFDSLKLDRSLVKQIDNNSQSLEIVQAIGTIAHDLNIHMTAAGVETIEQLAQLRSLKCEYAQGYLFSQPIAGEAAKNLLGVQLQHVSSP